MNTTAIKYVIFGALVVLVFALNHYNAGQFWETDALNGHDIVFQADANGRLRCFKNGKGGWGRSVAHPNPCGIINIPVRAMARVGELFTGIHRTDFYLPLALAVSPAAAALATGLIFLIAMELSLGIKVASLLALLHAASFSQVIFGSVPEFYSLGSLSIVLGLFVAVLSMRARIPIWVWILVAVFAGSITITNLAPIAVLYFLSLYLREPRTFWPAARSTAVVQVITVIVIVAGALSASAILNRPPLSENIGASLPFAFSNNLEQSPAAKFASFPNAIGKAILPVASDMRMQIYDPPRALATSRPGVVGEIAHQTHLRNGRQNHAKRRLIACVFTGSGRFGAALRETRFDDD